MKSRVSIIVKLARLVYLIPSLSTSSAAPTQFEKDAFLMHRKNHSLSGQVVHTPGTYLLMSILSLLRSRFLGCHALRDIPQNGCEGD